MRERAVRFHTTGMMHSEITRNLFSPALVLHSLALMLVLRTGSGFLGLAGLVAINVTSQFCFPTTVSKTGLLYLSAGRVDGHTDSAFC